MAYKALYRTYRPQRFSEIVGQEVVVKTLQNAIINKKTSHAYLFTGPRGTGKTSIARIFAKALNCPDFSEAEPCCHCSLCQEISDGINPDVIEIDAASNNGVDEIREIREKVKFLPSGSKYKIYIIDEVHMLSGGAFNALLKTLEEPPKHVIFVLATTEVHKLPATIISRCQKFEFKLLSIEDISYKIKEICQTENVVISEEAANSIAESSEGAMRDALSILDQAISYGSKEIAIDDLNGITGNLSFEKMIALAIAIDNQDIQTALECINDLLLLGKEISKIAVALLIFYRDALLYKSINVPHMMKYIFSKEKFQNIADNTPTNKLLYYIDLLSDIQNKVKSSSTPSVFLEIALIKMCSVSAADLDLKQRLFDLEQKLENGTFNIEKNEQAIDIEKITFIEGRINHIVSELSKLELHKLSAKVLELEQKNQPVEMNSLKETIINLEKQINEIKHQERVVNVNQDLDDNQNYIQEVNSLKAMIINLEKQIKEIQNQEATIESQKSSDEKKSSDNIVILSRLEGYQKELYQTNQNLESLRQEIALQTKHPTNKNSSFVKTDLTEVEEKITNLEKRIYQLMAGELAEKKVPTRKIKKPNGQIMLFGDNITTINDYQTKTKNKYDFADLEKPVEKENNSKSDIKEEAKVLEKEVKKVKPLLTETEIIIDSPENQKSKEDLPKEVEAQPQVQDVISVFYDHHKKEETTSKPHSSLVVREKPQKEVYDLEKQMIAHESGLSVKEKPPVLEDKNERLNDDVFIDKFATYEIKYIEQILHDTKNPESRNDKGRMDQLWKIMARGVDPEMLPIVETLQEGQIVAVGNKEFIIVFQNVSLCNQVMRPKFKSVALKILYNLLGDSYNYIAIPNNVWTEKSMEYKSQYFIGVKYPSLTAINIEGLEVIKPEDEYTSEKEKTISQTLEMFGDKIVTFD